MATNASIKGSAVISLVQDAAEVFASGRLSREDAARWLEPEDFELLDQRVGVSSWYDIESFRRLTEMMRDVVGGGDNAYIRERGRRAAQRLLDAGLYSQLDYLKRMKVMSASPEDRFEAFGRDLRMISSIAPSMLNFTKWSHKVDPDHDDRYILEVAEAGDFPEVLCWSTEGFINGMAPTSGDAQLWRWSRPFRDLVVYHMTRSVSLAG